MILIAGFHRSGTSLVAQLLARAGLFVGEDLLAADPSNKHGHYEDRDFLELHREILQRHGDDWQWDRPFGFHLGPADWSRMRELAARREAEHPRWGFKDPRACLFLGAWRAVLPSARTVVVYRDPGECVRSMESRQASQYLRRRGHDDRNLRFFREPDHGLRLWDTYNRALVSFVRVRPEECLVVPFSALTDGFPLVDAVNARLGAGLDPVATDTVFDPTSTSRREVLQRVFDPEVGRRVEQTWHDLEQLAAQTGGTA